MVILPGATYRQGDWDESSYPRSGLARDLTESTAVLLVLTLSFPQFFFVARLLLLEWQDFCAEELRVRLRQV